MMFSFRNALVFAFSILTVAQAAKNSYLFEEQSLSHYQVPSESYRTLSNTVQDDFVQDRDEPLSSLDSEDLDLPNGIRDSIVPTPYPLSDELEVISEDEASQVDETPAPVTTLFSRYSPDRSFNLSNLAKIMPRFNGFDF